MGHSMWEDWAIACEASHAAGRFEAAQVVIALRVAGPVAGHRQGICRQDARKDAQRVENLRQAVLAQGAVVRAAGPYQLRRSLHGTNAVVTPMERRRRAGQCTVHRSRYKRMRQEGGAFQGPRLAAKGHGPPAARSFRRENADITGST